jgi:hypothetical protein
MLHIKDAAKWWEQSQVMYKIRIENRSLLQLNIRSTNKFFLHVLGMCLKFWNVFFCCAGRSKIKWITKEIEMIGLLKINTRQYVPRICPFKYLCELHNVQMILRTNCLLFYKKQKYVKCYNKKECTKSSLKFFPLLYGQMHIY